MARQPRRLKFSPWVPVAAQHAIEAEWERYATFPNETTRRELRAALARLAIHPTMDTEVWGRLPEELAGSAIQWTMFLLAAFPTMGDPRLPRSKRVARQRWTQYWLMLDDQWPDQRAGSELLSETCAAISIRLREALLKAINDEEWSQNWPGDPALKDRARAARFFLDAAICFQSMLDASKSFKASLKLPPTAWPSNRKAQQRAFSESMSRRFSENCGHPYYAVVAALTAVAFDLPVGPSADSVRWHVRKQRQTDRRK